MKVKSLNPRHLTLTLGTCLTLGLLAQAPNNPRDNRPPGGGAPPPGGVPDPGGPPGFGPGGPGPMQRETQLVKQFDKDGDERLNTAERKAAREFIQKERAAGRGPGGFGGGGRGGGAGPGMMLAPQMISQGDQNSDRKLSREEFEGLAEVWFVKLDADKAGKLSQEPFSEKFAELIPPPQGFGGPGGPGGPGGGRGFGPGRFAGPALFTATDTDKDGSLTRTEWKETFGKWSTSWDTDKDDTLNEDELRTGLTSVLPRPNFGGPGGGRGPGRNENQKPPQPGPKLAPEEVKVFPDAPLYEPHTLRTLFLTFENDDWEKEMADFNNTDVDVPARLMVDGKTYPDVGVHFRGASSFGTVGEGYKRSLNLSLDFAHKDQHLGGYHTLNLLNSHVDPTFLRTVLYNHIAREYLPAPKANYVRVVINGESWGVYVNAQQFNKDFVKDWFGTTKGARWHVPGSPGGRANLGYLGDDPEAYKRLYTIKTKDNAKSWSDLIRLCKVLNETPADQLENALSPLLDIDGALKFLALEISLINNDGYWIRTSDFNIYQDEKGRFHVIPHDANETFTRPGGPGFGGRGGGGPSISGVELDPLMAANDANKPLYSKLLAVPALRTRYLGYVRDIAEKWLDWKKLSTLAQQYQTVIADDVARDTRKLYATETFKDAVTEDARTGGFGGGSMGLKNFADQRRTYLLNHPEIKKLAAR